VTKCSISCCYPICGSCCQYQEHEVPAGLLEREGDIGILFWLAGHMHHEFISACGCDQQGEVQEGCYWSVRGNLLEASWNMDSQRLGAPGQQCHHIIYCLYSSNSLSMYFGDCHSHIMQFLSFLYRLRTSGGIVTSRMLLHCAEMLHLFVVCWIMNCV